MRYLLLALVVAASARATETPLVVGPGAVVEGATVVSGEARVSPQPGAAPEPALAVSQAAGGWLVDEATLLAYMRQQALAEDLRSQLVREAKAREAAEAKADRTFLERHGLAVGLAVGVIGAVLVVWQATVLLRTAVPTQ